MVSSACSHHFFLRRDFPVIKSFLDCPWSGMIVCLFRAFNQNCIQETFRKLEFSRQNQFKLFTARIQIFILHLVTPVKEKDGQSHHSLHPPVNCAKGPIKQRGDFKSIWEETFQVRQPRCVQRPAESTSPWLQHLWKTFQNERQGQKAPKNTQKGSCKVTAKGYSCTTCAATEFGVQRTSSCTSWLWSCSYSIHWQSIAKIG